MSIDIQSLDSIPSGATFSTKSQTSFRGCKYLIEDLVGLLTSAGWTLVGSTYAAGFFTFPITLPTTDTTPLVGSKTPRGPWFLPFATLAGYDFDFYDPIHETPVTPAGVGNLIWFATGLTVFDTAISFAAAISMVGSYAGVASWDGFHASVVYTAIAPGPSYNFAPVSANGHWGISGYAQGGGWTYEATLAASVYQVRITAEEFGFFGLFHPGVPTDGWVRFSFIFPAGGAADAYIAPWPVDLGALPIYTILVNPHGFCIFDPLSDSSRSKTSMMVTAPSRELASSYCVFLIGEHTLRYQTSWVHSGTQAKVALNSNPAVTYSSVRLLGLRTPGTSPLKLQGGEPIVTAPYVFLGQPTEGCIGRLYDCILVNDYVSDIMFDSNRYTAIDSQTGTGGQTRTTLLWKS